MITDIISNLEKYAPLNPLLADVISFIREHDLNALALGRHQIKGADLYVNIELSYGRKPEEAPLEYHRQMTDLHIPLSGQEHYGWAPTSIIPHEDYDQARDIGFCTDVKPLTYITCTPSTFVIFGPQDAHAPLITEAETIKKAIFKIKSI